MIHLANALPDSPAAKHIAQQLTIGDWRLKIINRQSEIFRCANLMKTQLMEELIDENQQLCRILNASVKTAKEQQQQGNEKTGLLTKTDNDN